MAHQSRNPVRIIVIGAHPDDCEAFAGGTAALLADLDHAVKFLTLTNGDAGHHILSGNQLAQIRASEAREVRRRLGIAEYQILPNHDGLLQPTLEVRLQVIREIRKWDADVVMTHRPNDYHPDHRYAGILVQDAAYMVGVPNIAPDVPPLRKNPLFLYMQDGFQKPYPFSPDIAVDITETWDRKIDALDANTSQMYEWLPWMEGVSDQVPDDPAERRSWLESYGWLTDTISPEVRTTMRKWYGEERAATAKRAEAFEICEYGLRPTEEDIRRLFPMLDR